MLPTWLSWFSLGWQKIHPCWIRIRYSWKILQTRLGLSIYFTWYNYKSYNPAQFWNIEHIYTGKAPGLSWPSRYLLFEAYPHNCFRNQHGPTNFWITLAFLSILQVSRTFPVWTEHWWRVRIKSTGANLRCAPAILFHTDWITHFSKWTNCYVTAFQDLRREYCGHIWMLDENPSGFWGKPFG